jgi:hypothetical protein
MKTSVPYAIKFLYFLALYGMAAGTLNLFWFLHGVSHQSFIDVIGITVITAGLFAALFDQAIPEERVPLARLRSLVFVAVIVFGPAYLAYERWLKAPTYWNWSEELLAHGLLALVFIGEMAAFFFATNKLVIRYFEKVNV